MVPCPSWRRLYPRGCDRSKPRTRFDAARERLGCKKRRKRDIANCGRVRETTFRARFVAGIASRARLSRAIHDQGADMDRTRQMGPALLPTPLSPARGLVFRRTFRRALGARCLPFSPASRRSGSVTGARAGIRSCPRFGRSEDPPSSGETETGHPLVARHLERFRVRRSFRVTIDVRPECPACSGLLSRSSRTGHLHPAEAFLMWSSKTARTVSATSSGFEKFFVFRSLDRHSKGLSLPSDEQRLRRRSESFKVAKPHFSTFQRIACGREWITQRFGANIIKSRSEAAIGLE